MLLPFIRNTHFAARILFFSGLMWFSHTRCQAQIPSTLALESAKDFALDYIREHPQYQGQPASDLQELLVTDAYVSRLSGNTHIYLRQAYQGIGIYGAELNICLGKDNEVVVYNNGAFQGIEEKVAGNLPLLEPVDALRVALLHYGWTEVVEIVVTQPSSGKDRYTVLRAENISPETIPTRLMYQLGTDGQLHLCWDISLYLPDGGHWWSLRIDAASGEVMDENDWMLSCDFGPAHTDHEASAASKAPLDLSPASIVSVQAANTYAVFDMPVESPGHGSRSLVVSPGHPTASPFGWHDTNGAAGAEFTITQGNNVLVQEDINGNDGSGYSPDGGPTLDFDFPLTLNLAPSNYLDAALVNLFYWNNLVHDYAYQHGFDEVSGNFQQNNYGKGGTGADFVLADGQDGSGTNNANFATPAEGASPRMQMFLWSGTTTVFFTVNSPSAIAGSYTAIEAAFGPGLSTTPVTANLVLADASTNLACGAIPNPANIAGKIALVDRGTCAFINKVQNAQNAGAIACIVCNNNALAPFAMTGATGGITIPSVMISQADCNLLKAQLAAGVNVSLSNSGPAVARDGDLDNGIIAHEYGHGISNRLTGGPANVNCLNNQEQMGEGWSDYLALMMTMKATDVATTRRGIGTYVLEQTPTGNGIRPAPYTTDMAVNDFTYADITNTTTISLPHGIGFLWCNMLWEMTWNLVDDFGFDADLINGTGGNNMAMQLVMEGMRLQPCSPGFVSGRDAILAADVSLFGGTHACQIWSAFAKRGLGFSASQGSSNNRLDGFEAFDVPPTACSTLPVSWLEFTATPLSRTIRVDWKVATELQNEGFDVERKAVATAFESLGFVPGNNSHSVQAAYSFEDKTALPGITYIYRLRQTDLDGGVHFSSLAEATLPLQKTLEIALYPNPVSDLLTIAVLSQPEPSLEVQVFDLVGHRILTHAFSSETAEHALNLSEFSAGVYLLKIQSGNLQDIRRIVVE